jgi:hypothetical protein
MYPRLFAAAAPLALLCPLALAGDIDLGVADDDVWAYVSAVDPATANVVNAWGSFDSDLNPQGFPGTFPQANFWSHVFVGWDTGVIPADFRWGGATVTIRLATDTWVPEDGDVFVRMLNRGFDEATWNIFGNTPVPVPALGQFAGNDAAASLPGDVITIQVPADIDRGVVFEWLTGGQVYLAITADNAPPPPSGGKPPDLTGSLQIYSSEDVFQRGPRVVLHPGRLGDTNGDGAVDFEDLNNVLSDFNVSGEGLPGDLDRDGSVGFDDLNEVVSFFNT